MFSYRDNGDPDTTQKDLLIARYAATATTAYSRPPQVNIHTQAEGISFGGLYMYSNDRQFTLAIQGDIPHIKMALGSYSPLDEIVISPDHKKPKKQVQVATHSIMKS